MTIDSFPTSLVRGPYPATREFDPQVDSLTAYGGSSKEAIRPGSVHRMTVAWDLLDQDETAVVWGFLARQMGPAGRFYMPLFDYRRSGGMVQGAVVSVNGAGQVGSTLVVTGMSGTDPVLKAGDLVTVPDATGAYRHVHTVKADVDASDNAIPLVPDLYEPPLDTGLVAHKSYGLREGAVLVTAIWQLETKAIMRTGMLSSISFTAVTAPTGLGI